ncbi:MAG: M23 family metallopeptidase [Oligoflexia bacterium]|nr:M23 family metallopeptidase [Oligoflexia bacterium]
MQTIIVVLLTFFITSCSLFTKRSISNDQSSTEIKSEVNSDDLQYLEKYSAMTKEVFRGESNFVEVLIPEMPGYLSCNDKKIKTFYRQQAYVGFVSAGYFNSKVKQINCFWIVNGIDYLVTTFNVLDKKYPAERIYVDKKRVFLSKKDQAIVAKERKFKDKIYASSPARPYFEYSFQLPIEAVKTSEYGTQRVYNGKKKSSHLGVDYRAAVGTPIKASNTGKVVIARDLFYTGYTVVIDHGLDIFTIYAHLSKLMVSEGERVPLGTVIGLAGATGRVTGPHLHWGVTVNGQAINGESLVENSLFLEEK